MKVSKLSVNNIKTQSCGQTFCASVVLKVRSRGMSFHESYALNTSHKLTKTLQFKNGRNIAFTL